MKSSKFTNEQKAGWLALFQGIKIIDDYCQNNNQEFNENSLKLLKSYVDERRSDFLDIMENVNQSDLFFVENYCSANGID